MAKKSRIYDEYHAKKQKEKEGAKQLQEAVDREIDIIKKYLDTEEIFILEDKSKEKKITDDELKRIEDEFKKLTEDVIDPLKKRIDEKNRIAEEERELERKGMNDVELDDVLDEDDGIKQGLKVAEVKKDHLQQSLRTQKGASLSS